MKKAEKTLGHENLPSSVVRQVLPKGTKWRVKIFEDEEGDWISKGIGGAQIIREVILIENIGIHIYFTNNQ
jgi:hypothetical protein